MTITLPPSTLSLPLAGFRGFLHGFDGRRWTTLTFVYSEDTTDAVEKIQTWQNGELVTRGVSAQTDVLELLRQHYPKMVWLDRLIAEQTR